MGANPVRRYHTPAYPTRLEALADPALLKEHLPSAWRLKPELAGAVAIFLAANTFVNAADESTPKSARNPVAPKAAIVAPIFQHGQGRGATGCVVVAAPVFLSEEEALQLITDELTSAGLKVTNRNVVLKEVEIPRRTEDYSGGIGGGKEKVKELPDSAKPLRVDLEDGGHSVAVEFVSAKNYLDLGGVESMSTVQGYDFRAVAQDLAKQVGKKGKGVYFGAFYDPAAAPDIKAVQEAMAVESSPATTDTKTTGTQATRQELQERWKEIETKAQAESKRLLREQVKDFVDWLQGQGAI